MKKTIIYSACIIAITLFFSVIPSCSNGIGNKEDPKFISEENSPYPFSLAVKAGELVFVSGVLGTDKNGQLNPDFRIQSVQTMENIKERIEKLGYSMKDIVKCTVMIKDMSKWAEFNEVYKTYFEKGRYPARSAMGVSGLAMGAEMEVEVVLYKAGGLN
ncbi:MAG: RidA family protein [Bacteroidales bacterium]